MFFSKDKKVNKINFLISFLGKVINIPNIFLTFLWDLVCCFKVTEKTRITLETKYLLLVVNKYLMFHDNIYSKSLYKINGKIVYDEGP